MPIGTNNFIRTSGTEERVVTRTFTPGPDGMRVTTWQYDRIVVVTRVEVREVYREATGSETESYVEVEVYGKPATKKGDPNKRAKEERIFLDRESKADMYRRLGLDFLVEVDGTPIDTLDHAGVALNRY